MGGNPGKFFVIVFISIIHQVLITLDFLFLLHPLLLFPFLLKRSAFVRFCYIYIFFYLYFKIEIMKIIVSQF